MLLWTRWPPPVSAKGCRRSCKMGPEHQSYEPYKPPRKRIFLTFWHLISLDALKREAKIISGFLQISKDLAFDLILIFRLGDKKSSKEIPNKARFHGCFEGMVSTWKGARNATWTFAEWYMESSWWCDHCYHLYQKTPGCSGVSTGMELVDSSLWETADVKNGQKVVHLLVTN